LLLLDDDLIACPSCGALMEVLTFDPPALTSDSGALKLISEASSEDGLDFSAMSNDELFEIAHSGFGRYQQKEVDGAKNELKNREHADPRVVSNFQGVTGAAPPPGMLTSVSDSKLYSVGQITLATYLGAPIAGCLLLAQNYRALGKRDAVWQPLVAGIASTILLFIITFFLSEDFPSKILPAVYTSMMYGFARQWQGDAINNHLQAGGRKGSWAATIMIGLGCLVIVLGLLFAFVITFDLEP
jgi:hypothetical protein